MNVAKPFPAGSAASSDGSAEPSWSLLVESIRAGEDSGMEELYRIFSKGVRFYLYRQLGSQDIDDRIHDVFLIITQSIRRGELREPDRLMGYVRTILRRQVANHIDAAVQTRRSHADLSLGVELSDGRPDPEQSAIDRQKLNVAMRILRSLPERDREVLMRFYLEEQEPEQICRDLELTGNQFRLIKSRAKARFGELGKRRFSLRRTA